MSGVVADGNVQEQSRVGRFRRYLRAAIVVVLAALIFVFAQVLRDGTLLPDSNAAWMAFAALSLPILAHAFAKGWARASPSGPSPSN